MHTAHLTGRTLLPVLKNRNFLYLWLAQGISQIGQNMLNYLVIVLVEQLTGSSTQTGLAILSFLLPSVLFAGVAGVVVDHTNKRTMLIATTVLRAVTAAGYFVYLLHGKWRVGYLVLIIDLATLVRTCVNQFFFPAEHAAIPLLVERKHFFTVNTLIGISTNVFTVVGFILLGPFLLKFMGIRTVLWTIVGLFLAASAALTLLPRQTCGTARNSDLVSRLKEGVIRLAGKAWRALLREVRDSWSFIRRDRAVTVAIAYSSIVQALALMIGTLAPGFATRVLQQTPEDAIVVVLPAGLGMFFGFLAIGFVSRRATWQRLVNGSMLVCGVALTGLAATPLLERLPNMPPLGTLNLAHPVLLVSIAWCLMLGVANSFITVPTQTVLQDRIPEEAYGRVFANRLLATNIASMAPVLLAGAMADLVGIIWVLGGVGLLTLAMTAFGVVYLRPTHKPAEEQPEG